MDRMDCTGSNNRGYRVITGTIGESWKTASLRGWVSLKYPAISLLSFSPHATSWILLWIQRSSLAIDHERSLEPSTVIVHRPTVTSSSPGGAVSSTPLIPATSPPPRYSTEIIPTTTRPNTPIARCRQWSNNKSNSKITSQPRLPGAPSQCHVVP